MTKTRTLLIVLGGSLAVVLPFVLFGLFLGHVIWQRPHVIDLESAIPATPAPLAELNTEWDDYNSAPRFAGPVPRIEFVWSTNRESRGGTFDLWEAAGILLEGARLEIRTAPEPVWYLNSAANEFGPFPVDFDTENRTRRALDDPGLADSPTLIFASDRPGGKGGFDLYFMRFPDPFAATSPSPEQPPRR